MKGGGAWLMVGFLAFVAVVARGQTPQPPQTPPAVVYPALAGPIQAALADAHHTSIADLSQTERAQLRAIYEKRGWTPLWVDGESRPHADARAALQLLHGASADGLDPRDYRVASLSDIAATLHVSTRAATDVAAFDVGLSASVVLFFRDLHIGRVDPREVGFRLTIQRDAHDFPALVLSALAAHRLAETAAELPPQFALYRGLRSALVRYRTLASNPPPDLPVPANRSVRPGETYAGLPALQRQLTALGDWPGGVSPSAASAVYEDAFVEGVRHFQIRHGLDADGVLGRETLEALRVPLASRVRQIELGLERLRWLPPLGKGRLLVVNIPMFRLWAWDAMIPGDTPVFSSRVIVGRALNTTTPVFVEEMRHIIFRPYWNVPASILRNEILPDLVRDPGYLHRQNMEIVDGPGDDDRIVDLTAESVAALRQGRLRVRQRPGPSNALGLVKFVFPNYENVYLHGTPAKKLFARSRRDFSHGCIRVEDPDGLAEWVLSAQGDWTRDRIQAAMNGLETTRVDLKQPITVIPFYITAVVTPEDGTVHFARDIYMHDSKLDGALGLRSTQR